MYMAVAVASDFSAPRTTQTVTPRRAQGPDCPSSRTATLAATDQRGGQLSHERTIIPDAKEHFLTHSTRRDTYIVGGLGLSQQGRATIQGPRRQPRSPRIPRTTDYAFRTDAAYLNNPTQRGKQRQRFRHRQ